PGATATLSGVYVVVRFSMLGRRLIATLFPYTTLFRSCRDSNRKTKPERGRDCGLVRKVVIEVFDAMSVATKHDVWNELKRLFKIDRKSTRLNSSHVKISYAVFCLKKQSHTGSEDASAV